MVPDLWPKIEPIYRRVLDTGEAVVNVELQGEVPAAPGEIRSWLASYYPVRVDDEVIGIGVIVADVTDRQQEEDLRSVVMEQHGRGPARDGPRRRWSAHERRGVHDARLEPGRDPRDAGSRRHPFPSTDRAQCSEPECELLKAQIEGRTVRIAEDSFTRRDGSTLPVAYSGRSACQRHGGARGR